MVESFYFNNDDDDIAKKLLSEKIEDFRIIVITSVKGLRQG